MPLLQKLDPEKAALVLVDIQGKLSTLMQEEAQLIRHAAILIKAASLFELPIFWLEQLPDKLGPTRPELSSLLPDHQAIHKSTFSACGAEDFQHQLMASGRSQVILAGIEAHVCVWQTALDLLQRAFQVWAVSDAISSRTADNRALGLARMQQVGVRLTSTEMTLFELQGCAEGERFRQLIQLIR